MSNPPPPRYDFELELKAESVRVLEDALMQRAPVQSQLLRYLVDQELTGNAPPTQYEIAVDGLGKPDDYDLEGDSYPRVQISRLRKSLENYYARNQAGNGLQIVLDAGSYRLNLVPSRVSLSAKPTSASSRMGGAWSKFLATPRLIGFASLGAIGLVSSALLLIQANGPSRVEGFDKPSIGLVLDSQQSIQGLDLPRSLTDTARQVAEIQLANSFVSKPLVAGQELADADYSLTLNYGPGTRVETIAHLALADSDGEILYRNSIPYDPGAPDAFGAELEASLIYMTSPTGAIAQAELANQIAPVSTDYGCFLAIENRRSHGDATAQLVNDCIERFPDSSYRAFWYSRRAFTRFQRDIAEGRAIEKSGSGWDDLNAALEADRFNAFANFTAAKVELAMDNCPEASSYVQRAMERGNSYPALVAALEVGAASCPMTSEERKAAALRVRSLVKFNPDPDELLYLYLVFASLSAGDRETAEMVSARAVFDDPTGPVETTSRLLQRALADPVVAREEEDRLSDAIGLFVWNGAASARVVEELKR